MNTSILLSNGYDKNILNQENKMLKKGNNMPATNQNRLSALCSKKNKVMQQNYKQSYRN